MFTTIKGVYTQGKIIFKEAPPIKQNAEVLITFLEEEIIDPIKLKERKFGGLEGKLKLPDDFNEPLEELNDYM